MPKNERRVFVAKETFFTELDGAEVVIRKGKSVREGHPLLKGREELFAEAVVEYEVEDASAAPGKKRGDA